MELLGMSQIKLLAKLAVDTVTPSATPNLLTSGQGWPKATTTFPKAKGVSQTQGAVDFLLEGPRNPKPMNFMQRPPTLQNPEVNSSQLIEGNANYFGNVFPQVSKNITTPRPFTQFTPQHPASNYGITPEFQPNRAGTAYTQNRDAFLRLRDNLHAGFRGGPRAAAHRAALEQLGKSPASYQNSDSGYDLVAGRYSPEDIKKYLLTDEGAPVGSKYDTTYWGLTPHAISENYAYAPVRYSSALRESVQELGTRPSVINHELEHAKDQAFPFDFDKNKLPLALQDFSKDTKEIGPTIGDLAFAAAQFKKHTGRPLEHQVDLLNNQAWNPPETSAPQHDINWIEQQARQHGYFDGRSMHDLIFNTAEGQRWFSDLIEQQKARDLKVEQSKNNYERNASTGLR